MLLIVPVGFDDVDAAVRRERTVTDLFRLLSDADRRLLFQNSYPIH